MTDVQIETEPVAAAEIAGDRIDVLRAFASDLGERGETLGLIGPLEPPRLWTRHLLNSAILAPLIEPGARVADIGTGGGMPGLVLAIVRPDATFKLIEPMERRVTWLQEQTDALELQNVTIVRARGEEWSEGAVLDAVTARAVSALKTLVPLTAPLVRVGGELVLLKGANAANEIEAASKQLRKYGLDDVRVEMVGDGVIAEPTRVVRATRTR